MKRYEAYDLFSRRYAGPYAPMPEDYDVTGHVNEAIWNRFAASGFILRDVRLYGDDRLWTRFDQKNGTQVVVGWTRGGMIEAWSVPLEDCGAYTDERRPYRARTMDVWRFVRQIGETALVLRENAIAKTIRALDLFGFKGVPDEFPVGIVNGSTRSIAKELWDLTTDEAKFNELVQDEDEEARTWKRCLLRLTAALGGNAPAQRETAWRVDDGNKTAPGFKKDDDLAVYWYTKAAKQGDGLAANNLACFCVGDGDCVNAKRWFRVAIKGGVKKAKDSLRQCEECGGKHGVAGIWFCR